MDGISERNLRKLTKKDVSRHEVSEADTNEFAQACSVSHHDMDRESDECALVRGAGDYGTGPYGQAGHLERVLSLNPGEDTLREKDVSLSDAIVREVIPRLAMVHKMDSHSFQAGDKISELIEAKGLEGGFPGSPVSYSRDEIDAFAAAVVEGSEARAYEATRLWLENGNGLESLYLDLFPKTAARLGEHWEDDTLNFIEVTIGVSRLQKMFRDLSHQVGFGTAGMPVSRVTKANGTIVPHVALFPVPGDQHTFGVSILSELFREYDWKVSFDLTPSADDIVQLVAEVEIDLIGLSMSVDGNYLDLISLIRAIRSSSLNPNIKVMVGGHSFHTNPDFLVDMDADSTALDARQAIVEAHSLLGIALGSNIPETSV